jgi:hypothetical protein
LKPIFGETAIDSTGDHADMKPELRRMLTEWDAEHQLYINMRDADTRYAEYMLANHFKELKRPLKMDAVNIAKFILRYSPMPLVYVPNDKELFGRNAWYYYYDEKDNTLYDLGVNHPHYLSLQYFTYHACITLLNRLERHYMEKMDDRAGSEVWWFNTKRSGKKLDGYLENRIVTEMKKMAQVSFSVAEAKP